MKPNEPVTRKKLIELVLDPKTVDLGNVGVALVAAARGTDRKP